jgi:hypothetical protein
VFDKALDFGLALEVTPEELLVPVRRLTWKQRLVDGTLATLSLAKRIGSVAIVKVADNPQRRG